jgi:predicted RNA binding protein YcfA (HicA-like mRNA interferase family)
MAMTVDKVPSIPFDKLINALKRDGWVVVRQRGSHIRLQKRTRDEVLKLTVPAHRPIKRSTLAHILKQARLTPDRLRDLL